MVAPLNGKCNLVNSATIYNKYDMVKFLLDVGASAQKTLGDSLGITIRE